MRGIRGVRAKFPPWLLPSLLRQMGTMVQLKDMGLFKSQGLIRDKWADAEDGRTLPRNKISLRNCDLRAIPCMVTLRESSFRAGHMIVRFGVHAHQAMESGTLLTSTMWDVGVVGKDLS